MLRLSRFQVLEVARCLIRGDKVIVHGPVSIVNVSGSEGTAHSWLGSSLSVLDAVRFGRYGMARLGSVVSVVDFVHLGSSLSFRSFSRLGSCSLSCRSFARFGSSLSVHRMATLGSSLSVLDLLHFEAHYPCGASLGLAPHCQPWTLCTLETHCPFAASLGLAPACRCMGRQGWVPHCGRVHFGSSLSLRSFARFASLD